MITQLIESPTCLGKWTALSK